MKERLVCSAVIAAAGASQRMNGLDKLFMEVNGAPVLSYTLAAFQRCVYIDEIIVVANEHSINSVTEICGLYGISKAEKIMTGGSIRSESVLNGVLAVSRETQLVAVHDGARPCVSVEIIENAIRAAMTFHAAAPGIPVNSTLKLAKSGLITETVDRADVFEIQTPQVFQVDLLKAALTNALKKGLDVTDDCQAAELIGVPIHITEGSAANIKLTTIDDFELVKAILGYRV